MSNPIGGGFGKKQTAHVGVMLEFQGDHQYHHVEFGSRDLTCVWDGDSLVLTIQAGESEAKDLFWDLLEVIPKLRHDRR